MHRPIDELTFYYIITNIVLVFIIVLRLFTQRYPLMLKYHWISPFVCFLPIPNPVLFASSFLINLASALSKDPPS